MAIIVGAVVAVAGAVVQDGNNRAADGRNMAASASAKQTQDLMTMAQLQQQITASAGASDAALLQAYGYTGAQNTATTGQAMAGVAWGGRPA